MPILLFLYNENPSLFVHNEYVDAAYYGKITSHVVPTPSDTDDNGSQSMTWDDTDSSSPITPSPEFLADKVKISVANKGIPTLIARFYQLQSLMLGDFEFILNNQYLQLDWERMYTVLFMPFLPFNNIILFPFALIWAGISVTDLIARIGVQYYNQNYGEIDPN